jgi:hypothetical protein
MNRFSNPVMSVCPATMGAASSSAVHLEHEPVLQSGDVGLPYHDGSRQQLSRGRAYQVIVIPVGDQARCVPRSTPGCAWPRSRRAAATAGSARTGDEVAHRISPSSTTISSRFGQEAAHTERHEPPTADVGMMHEISGAARRQ